MHIIKMNVYMRMDTKHMCYFDNPQKIIISEAPFSSSTIVVGTSQDLLVGRNRMRFNNVSSKMMSA